MAPMLRLEGLGGEISQPEEQRHRRPLADVLGQAASGLEVRVLDHVGGINPSLEPAVHAQRHHPSQPLTVLRQHRAPCRAITPRGRFQPPGALTVVIESCRVDGAHIC